MSHIPVQVVRSSRNRIAGSAGVVVVLLVTGAVGLSRYWRDRVVPQLPDALTSAKVEHVRGGHKIVLDDGQDVLYAGIRAPYADEPLFDEALKRNTELVGSKKVRLRYDETAKDKKDRLLAYVWADGVFVNELLVREGLAYVQLTTGHRRFEKEMLAAQAQARKHKLGLWRLPAPPNEAQYAADPKYGNFHRSSCEEVPKIKPERLVSFSKRTQAFDEGFAPCHQCRP